MKKYDWIRIPTPKTFNKIGFGGQVTVLIMTGMPRKSLPKMYKTIKHKLVLNITNVGKFSEFIRFGVSLIEMLEHHSYVHCGIRDFSYEFSCN